MECATETEPRNAKVQPGSTWLTRGAIPERVEVVAVDRAAGWATVRGADGSLRRESIETVNGWTRRSKSLDRFRRAA